MRRIWGNDNNISGLENFRFVVNGQLKLPFKHARDLLVRVRMFWQFSIYFDGTIRECHIFGVDKSDIKSGDGIFFFDVIQVDKWHNCLLLLFIIKYKAVQYNKSAPQKSQNNDKSVRCQQFFTDLIMDTKHLVSESYYEEYKNSQDVREGDILLIRDDTSLIGTCAMITQHDIRIIYQSHLYKTGSYIAFCIGKIHELKIREVLKKVAIFQILMNIFNFNTFCGLRQYDRLRRGTSA